MRRLFALLTSLLGLAVLMLAVVGMGPIAGLPRDYAQATRPEQSGEYSAFSPNELLTPTAVYTYYFPAIYHNYTVPSWQSLGLRGIWVRAIAVDPDGVLYAGTDGHGMYKSTDFGSNWHPINNGLWDDANIFQVEVDPFEPQAVYLSTNKANPWFFYSQDSGESWQPGGLFSHPPLKLKAHPALPVRLFAGDAVLDWAGGRVYRSDDGGLSWTTVLHEQVIATSIAASAPSPSPVTVGTVRGLYRSEDGGDTWAKLANGLPDSPVRGVALHPTDQLTAYVGTEVGIFKTTDGGDTWSVWGIDPPPYGPYNLLINGQNPATHYAIFGLAGVHISLDEGKHWQSMNTGLSSLGIYDLILDQTSSALYAATADGVWALRLVGEREQ